jgi:hypothetical protein
MLSPKKQMRTGTEIIFAVHHGSPGTESWQAQALMSACAEVECKCPLRSRFNCSVAFQQCGSDGVEPTSSIAAPPGRGQRDAEILALGTPDLAPDRFALQRIDARLEGADLVGERAVGQLAQPLGFGIQLGGHASRSAD